MDTTTNLRISIPKPCHEDWNKFTPDEKGAFCKVCSKSVHDFTRKSPEEIKTILVEELEAGKKVCGRFNEDQLEDAPALKGEMQEDLSALRDGGQLDPYSLNFQRVKKFVIALFLVFGGFLFNSVKSSAQKMGKIAYTCRLPLKGEVEYIAPPKKDSVIVIKDTIDAPTHKNPPPYSKYPVLLGDVMVEPVIETMIGQVAVIEDPIEEIVSADTAKAIEPEVLYDNMIMGMIVAPYDYEEPVITEPVPINELPVDTAAVIDGEFAVIETTYVASPQPSPQGEGATAVSVKGEEEAIEVEMNNVLSISSYPNPSSNGHITLRYDLKKDGFTGITLLDLNGRIVKTLLPLQSLYASTYETKYDVSDLKDGIYFCELISGNNKSTTRIVISK